MIEGLKVTSPSTCHVRGFFRPPCAEVGSPASDTPPRWGMIEGLRVTAFPTCEGDIALHVGSPLGGTRVRAIGFGRGAKGCFTKSRRIGFGVTRPHHRTTPSSATQYSMGSDPFFSAGATFFQMPQ